MQNAIYEICQRLRGYSKTEPYFEVLEVKAGKDSVFNDVFNLTVKVVNPDESEAENESNK